MTPSADRPLAFGEARRVLHLSIAVASGVALHGAEFLLPSPVPWMKPGLANVLTVLILFAYGARAAVTVQLLRVVIASFLVGTIFSPAFLLSFSGAMCSLAVMTGMVLVLPPPRVTPVSVSAAGGMAHLFGQILVARLVLIQHEAVWYLMPWLLAAGMVTGMVTGMAATWLLKEIRDYLGGEMEG